MASKKKREMDSALPLNVETENMEPSSSITYASDVIAIIAGLAASEVEGIAGMSNVSSGLLGKNRNITRGIKVEVGSEEVSVDIYLTVEYGTPIQRAARDCQESVKKSIESMTGLHVVRVDVHVQGVSFEKEMNALQAGAGKARLESGDAEPAEAKTSAEKKASGAKKEPEIKETGKKKDISGESSELPEKAEGEEPGTDVPAENAAEDDPAAPSADAAKSAAVHLGEDEELADAAFAAEEKKE